MIEIEEEDEKFSSTKPNIYKCAITKKPSKMAIDTYCRELIKKAQKNARDAIPQLDAFFYAKNNIYTDDIDAYSVRMYLKSLNDVRTLTDN